MAGALSMQLHDDDFLKTCVKASPTHRPRSVAELGVRGTVLEDLALKTLFLSGTLSVLELAERLCLSYELTDSLFCQLRAEMLCQATGMTGHVHHIAISAPGRARAVELLAQNQYVGPAPVSLEQYAEQVRTQSGRKSSVHAQQVRNGFAHLVVDLETLRKFGTALNSGSSMFLWGPAGNGKTTMAEALARVISNDPVWIPHAIEVDGQIITVYDPSIHKAVPEPQPDDHDARWVLCERPSVIVGGELTAEMLDLQFNMTSKFYVAPAQIKANNGVLIIDDFGRQRLRPEELLNRWVVPLDRKIDFLTLSGGRKIEVPFEMLVVFASNMHPAELVDPAFMRRIQTKIRIGEVSDEQFCEIFRRVGREKNVTYDASIPTDLIEFIRLSMGQQLRSCYPRDIVNQVFWAAQYEGRKPHIDRPALKQALDAYFVDEREGSRRSTDQGSAIARIRA